MIGQNSFEIPQKILRKKYRAKFQDFVTSKTEYDILKGQVKA